MSLLVELAEILRISLEKNNAREITGALIYADGYFVQMLEGEQSDVFSLYQRIARDPRHTRVTLLSFNPIQKRILSPWTMGMAIKNRFAASIFTPYLHRGRFDPDTLTSAELMTLMAELATAGLYSSNISSGGTP